MSLTVPAVTISSRSLTLSMWRESFERAREKMHAAAETIKAFRNDLILLSRKFVSENDPLNRGRADTLTATIEQIFPFAKGEVELSSEKESLTKEAAADDLDQLALKSLDVATAFISSLEKFQLNYQTYRQNLEDASQKWNELEAFQAERSLARLKEQLPSQ